MQKPQLIQKQKTTIQSFLHGGFVSTPPAPASALTPQISGANAPLPRPGFQLKSKPHCKSNSPQQAQLVFLKTLLRMTDGADDFSPDILLSPMKIQQGSASRIVKECVDGEVATRGILRAVCA